MNPPRSNLPPGFPAAVNGQPKTRLHYRLQSRSPWPASSGWAGGSPVHWVVVMPMLHFLVALAVAFLATELFGEPSGPQPSWAYSLVVAPWLETFFLRMLPILTFRALGAPAPLLLVIGWLPTAALAFLSGSVHGLATGVVGGFFLSISYVAWLDRSPLVAFCVSASHQLVVNAIVFFVVACTGRLLVA